MPRKNLDTEQFYICITMDFGNNTVAFGWVHSDVDDDGYPMFVNPRGQPTYKSSVLNILHDKKRNKLIPECGGERKTGLKAPFLKMAAMVDAPALVRREVRRYIEDYEGWSLTCDANDGHGVRYTLKGDSHGTAGIPAWEALCWKLCHLLLQADVSGDRYPLKEMYREKCRGVIFDLTEPVIAGDEVRGPSDVYQRTVLRALKGVMTVARLRPDQRWAARFTKEPVAAFLGAGHDWIRPAKSCTNSAGEDESSLILIVDLGFGTLDYALVRRHAKDGSVVVLQLADGGEIAGVTFVSAMRELMARKAADVAGIDIDMHFAEQAMKDASGLARKAPRQQQEQQQVTVPLSNDCTLVLTLDEVRAALAPACDALASSVVAYIDKAAGNPSFGIPAGVQFVGNGWKIMGALDKTTSELKHRFGGMTFFTSNLGNVSLKGISRGTRDQKPFLRSLDGDGGDGLPSASPTVLTFSCFNAPEDWARPLEPADADDTDTDDDDADPVGAEVSYVIDADLFYEVIVGGFVYLQRAIECGAKITGEWNPTPIELVAHAVDGTTQKILFFRVKGGCQLALDAFNRLEVSFMKAYGGPTTTVEYVSKRMKEMGCSGGDFFMHAFDVPYLVEGSKIELMMHLQGRNAIMATVGYPGGESSDPAELFSALAPAPTASGPAASGPAASGPAASGPAASGPAASGPAASGPAASGPAASGPAASGPAASGPAASGPAASGPAASGPAASGPAASGQDTRSSQRARKRQAMLESPGAKPGSHFVRRVRVKVNKNPTGTKPTGTKPTGTKPTGKKPGKGK